MTKYLPIIYIICLTLLCNSVFAEQFKANKANGRLDKLSLELSVVNVRADRLTAAVKELQSLKSKAETCVAEAKAEIAEVNKLLSEANEGEKIDVITSANQFLFDKKKQILSRQSDCKLFVIRADEAIDVFGKALEKLVTTKRLAISNPVWKNLYNSVDLLYNPSKYFSLAKLQKHFAWQQLKPYLIYSLFLLIAASLATLLFRNILTRYMRSKPDLYSEKMMWLFLSLLKKYSYGLILSSVFVAFTAVLSLLDIIPPHLSYFSIGFTGLFIYLMVVGFFVYDSSYPAGLGFFPSEVKRAFALHLEVFAYLCLIGYLGWNIIPSQLLTPEMTLSIRTLFLTLFMINLNTMLWVLTHVNWLFTSHRNIRVIVLSLLICFFSLNLAMEWFGLHYLTDYILVNFSISLILLFFTWTLHQLIMNALDILNRSRRSWQQNIRRKLGIRKIGAISEIYWIKMGSTIVIWGVAALILMRIWFMPIHQFDDLSNAIINGFELSNIPIVPIRIVAAIFLFPILSLTTRALRRQVAIRSQAQTGRGVQNSIAALVGYAGFSAAFIFSLLLAGINLTGLALIAGALSVGIGFGLQNIVNNFVSGIILLVERPIKPGDRVLVGEHEGHVKSISIRSTIIRSMNRTDVILPNSQLISGEVVNLMLEDSRTRLQLYVGVAYGSNTKLVHKLLHEITLKHPEIINEGRNVPLILFNNFGDSCLEFEIRIVIKDVNKRQDVRSDLHFLIDDAFRANNIEIPFPQQDVYIKQFPDKT